MRYASNQDFTVLNGSRWVEKEEGGRLDACDWLLHDSMRYDRIFVKPASDALIRRSYGVDETGTDVFFCPCFELQTEPLEFSFNTNFAQRLSFILERSSRSAQRHITKQIKVPREYAAHIPSPNEGAYQFKFCWARVFDQTNCRWEYFELEYL